MSITVPTWRAGTCAKCQEFTDVNHDDVCRSCQEYKDGIERVQDLQKEPDVTIQESPLRRRRRELVAEAKLQRLQGKRANV